MKDTERAITIKTNAEMFHTQCKCGYLSSYLTGDEEFIVTVECEKCGGKIQCHAEMANTVSGNYRVEITTFTGNPTISIGASECKTPQN